MNEETLRSAETAPEEEVLPIEPTTVEETAPVTQTAAQPPIEFAGEESTQEEPVASDITHRLAEEFFRLREEFPAIHSPEQLPDAVLDMAAKNDLSLFDAYLRFCHEEEKRIRQEEERRRLAAARSAGSLVQGVAEANPEQDAFLRAFRTALK